MRLLIFLLVHMLALQSLACGMSQKNALNSDYLGKLVKAEKTVFDGAHILFKTKSANCVSCENDLRSSLMKIKGVEEVFIDLESQKIGLNVEAQALHKISKILNRIPKALKRIGFEPSDGLKIQI